MRKGFTDSRGRRWEPDPTGRHAFRGRADSGWTDYVIDAKGTEPVRDREGGELARGSAPLHPVQRLGILLALVFGIGTIVSFIQRENAKTDIDLERSLASLTGTQLTYLAKLDSMNSAVTTWTIVTWACLAVAVVGVGLVVAFRGQTL